MLCIRAAVHQNCQMFFLSINIYSIQTERLSTEINTFEGCVFSGVWDNQLIPGSLNLLKNRYKWYKDFLSQHWTSEINSSSKWLNYRIFTTTLNLKTCLVNLSYHDRFIMAKIPCRNHSLHIESGCRRDICRNFSICELCTKDIGHYIFNCPRFENIQKNVTDTHLHQLNLKRW